MAADSPARFWALWIAVLLAVLPVVILVFPPAGSTPSSGGPVGTSGAWGFGGGLVTISHVQNVTATPYWDTYCPSPYPFEPCADPEAVAYLPAANVVVLTEVETSMGGTNALLEFNPGSLERSSPLSLACSPLLPFYDGRGVDLFVPCVNSTTYASGSFLVVNYQTESIVTNISMPFRAFSMAYDSTNGMIYAGANGNALATIDPTNDTILNVRNVTGASFLASVPYNFYTLVFDPATDQLIVPSSTDRLLTVNPADGIVTASLPLPSTAVSLAVDPATDQLFASTFEPSALLIFNATTYALEANISIPNCILVCVEPNEVNQVLIDPAHGDAYLLSTAALITLNLSKLETVSAIEDYGDGPSASAAYAPLNDRIFGTYATYAVGPGFLIQLNHANHLALTSILWLPTSPGILVLAAVVGSVIALLGLGGDRKGGARRASMLPASPSAPTDARGK